VIGNSLTLSSLALNFSNTGQSELQPGDHRPLHRHRHGR